MRSSPAYVLKVVLVAASMFLCGCFMPRSRASLAFEARPQSETVLAPVSIDRVSVVPASVKGESLDRSQEQAMDANPQNVMRKSNEILDTLAGDADGRLIGPTAALKKPALAPEALEIRAFLERGIAVASTLPAESGTLANTSAGERGDYVARTLGAQNVIRLTIRVTRPPMKAEVFYQIGFWFRSLGEVTVTAELESIFPARSLGRGIGKANFEAVVGIIYIVPFGGGTLTYHAIDEATRAALQDLKMSDRLP